MSKIEEYKIRGVLMFKIENYVISIEPVGDDYHLTIRKPTGSVFSMAQPKAFFFEYDLIEIVDGIVKPTPLMLTLVEN